MKNKFAKKTRLVAAMAVLMAPALAYAQDAAATPGQADATRDPYSMQTDESARDAYREGLIWGTYVANPALDAYRLNVDVQRDRAVLTGRVETGVEKLLAQRIALRAPGVTRVDNRIQVDPMLIVAMVPVPVQGAAAQDRSAQGTGRSEYSRNVADDTLAAMVNSRLLWSPKTDATDINVTARNGVVTLTGRADNMAAKNEATRLAQATRGTVRVDNRLSVASKGQVAQAEAGEGDNAMSDTWVAAKVNSSLLWSAGVDASDIDVEARQGVVTLTGQADSVAAKRQAVELAQSVRGVKRVDASGLRIESGDAVTQG